MTGTGEETQEDRVILGLNHAEIALWLAVLTFELPA